MSVKRPKRRKRPFGVTVLAILQTFSGIQLLIQAIMFFIFAAIVSSPEVQANLSSVADENLAESLPVIFSLLGLVFLAISILSFHLARGYLRGHEWARRRGRKLAIVALLFAMVGLVLMPGRVDPGASIWTVLFNVFILIYLNRGRVKSFFK